MDVVNESVDDAELERLLTQLLRVVSPAPAGESPGPARAAGGSDASVLPADLLEAGLRGLVRGLAAEGLLGEGSGNGRGEGAVFTFCAPVLPSGYRASPRALCSASKGRGILGRCQGGEGDERGAPSVRTSQRQ